MNKIEYNKTVKRVSLDSDGPTTEVLNQRKVTRDNKKFDNMDDWEAEMLRKKQRLIDLKEMEQSVDEVFYKRRDQMNRKLRVSPPDRTNAKKWNPEFAASRINEFLEDCEKINAIPSLRSFEAYVPSKYPGETFSRKTAARYIKEYETVEALEDDTEYEIKSQTDGYKLGAIFHQLKMIGKDDLISGGLKGRYNANMAKFLASAEHGMVEKAEMVSTGSVEMIIVNDLESEDIEMVEKPNVTI